jgi:hypothetical protein
MADGGERATRHGSRGHRAHSRVSRTCRGQRFSMKVATLEAQVSVIKSEPPVRLAHFSPYPPGWRRMIAVYLYIFKTNTRACAWGPTRARSAPADGSLIWV